MAVSFLKCPVDLISFKSKCTLIACARIKFILFNTFNIGLTAKTPVMKCVCTTIYKVRD